MYDEDIRKFIKDNGIKVHDSDRFMQEVIRQIELLPSQSALDENEKKVLWVKAISEAEEKYNRRDAVFTASANLIVLSALGFVMLYLLPLAGGTSPAVDFAIMYRHLIFAALCLMISAGTLLNFFPKI